MKAVTFKAQTAHGDLVEITGYPTGAPGLVVHEAFTTCSSSGEEWMVSHARSGLAFPLCWPSPEGALAFADALGVLCDWRQNALVLRDALLGTGATDVVKESAARYGGRWHLLAERDVDPIDNGVIA
jgi:hypothetical protein